MRDCYLLDIVDFRFVRPNYHRQIGTAPVPYRCMNKNLPSGKDEIFDEYLRRCLDLESYSVLPKSALR